ncbi:MAG: cupin domain-containing protein [Gemmatimonadetes bacterium]|nr:cupin domain-containing protein [Gemmatimonadota bacterium]
MAIEVFDVRHDIKNLFVSPQIRARFLQMKPGETSQMHSHDLGHEVFLILMGRALFEIGEDSAELGPGQLCIATTDQPHSVTVLGDDPMTMYLSVTPHVQPTHTFLDRDGERLPTQFMPSAAYDTDTDTRTPMEELVNRFVDMSDEFAKIAQTAAEEQRMTGARLTRALSSGNMDAADSQREAIWFALYRVYHKLEEVTEIWNAVAPRAGRVK